MALPVCPSVCLSVCPSVCPAIYPSKDISKSFTAMTLKLGIYLPHGPVRMPVDFGIVTLIFEGQIWYPKGFRAISMKLDTDACPVSGQIPVDFGGGHLEFWGH